MRVWLAVLGGIVASSVQAAPGPEPEAALFDAPQGVKRTEGPGITPAQSFDCTWYADTMVRETQTDSPGTGPSYLVPRVPNGPRPACPGIRGPRDVELATSLETFVGRRGGFLFYEPSDANGAEPFSIRRLPDGKKIYSDKMKGYKAVSVLDGVLHLTYVRAYDAPCSLLKDAAACWARSMKEGHFVRAIAAERPPVADCVKAYGAGKTSPDDTSTITYVVEMTLTADGGATVLSRGKLGCEPAG